MANLRPHDADATEAAAGKKPSPKARSARPPLRADALSYDVVESCLRDGICRTLKYRAVNPDATKRGGLPFFPSFTVGRRRLILATDHRAWLEELKARGAAKPREAPNDQET